MTKRYLIRLLVVLSILLAAWLVYRGLSRYSFADIRTSVSEIPLRHFLAGLGFSALSYVCLTGFDALGLRYIGRPLPYHQSALASFTSLSIGHNVGIAALSSGAVRYRFYSRWGLTAEDVAKIILFCGLTVGLGLMTLTGLCLVIVPDSAARVSGLSAGSIRLVGAGCLLLSGVYLLLTAFVRGEVRIFKWRFDLPTLPIAAAQLVVGTANFACVAACLHQMIAGHADAATYLETATAFAMGNLMALVSHVPGGLGVMEATISYFIGGAASIGALIAFRVAYFFIPLPLGLLLLVISETLRPAADAGTDAVPQEAR